MINCIICNNEKSLYMYMLYHEEAESDASIFENKSLKTKWWQLSNEKEVVRICFPNCKI